MTQDKGAGGLISSAKRNLKDSLESDIKDLRRALRNWRLKKLVDDGSLSASDVIAVARMRSMRRKRTGSIRFFADADLLRCARGELKEEDLLNKETQGRSAPRDES